MKCNRCGKFVEACEASQILSAADLAALLVLKEHGYKDSVDRVIEAWRGHALPTCDPLSFS